MKHSKKMTIPELLSEELSGLAKMPAVLNLYKALNLLQEAADAFCASIEAEYKCEPGDRENADEEAFYRAVSDCDSIIEKWLGHFVYLYTATQA